MPELEILGAPQSNFVWVCRIAAAEKGVPVKLTPSRPHTPEIDAIHPSGKIPAMRHGDVTLFETLAICTYIDKAFAGPALVPADAKGAALADQWISYVLTEVDPVMVRKFLLGYFFPGTADGSPNRSLIEPALPAMARQMAILDKALAPTGHLVANGMTLADAFLLPILAYVKRTPEGGPMVAAHENVERFIATMMARRSVADTKPPPRQG